MITTEIYQAFISMHVAWWGLLSFLFLVQNFATYT